MPGENHIVQTTNFNSSNTNEEDNDDELFQSRNTLFPEFYPLPNPIVNLNKIIPGFLFWVIAFNLGSHGSFMIITPILFGCNNQTYEEQLQFNCTYVLNYQNLLTKLYSNPDDGSDNFLLEVRSRQVAYGIFTILSWIFGIFTMFTFCLINDKFIDSESTSLFTKKSKQVKFYQGLTVFCYRMTILFYMVQVVLQTCNFVVIGIVHRWFWVNLYVGWFGFAVGVLGLVFINNQYQLKIKTFKNSLKKFAHFIAFSLFMFSTKNWNSFDDFSDQKKGPDANTGRSYPFRTFQCVLFYLTSFCCCVTCKISILLDKSVIEFFLTSMCFLGTFLSVFIDTIVFLTRNNNGDIGTTTLWLADTDQAKHLLHPGDKLYYAYSFAWISSLWYLAMILLFYKKELFGLFDLFKRR